RPADALDPAAQPDHPFLRGFAAGFHGQLPGAEHAAVPGAAVAVPQPAQQPAGADALDHAEPADGAEPGHVEVVPGKPDPPGGSLGCCGQARQEALIPAGLSRCSTCCTATPRTRAPGAS